MYEISRGRIPFRLSLISAVVGSALIAAYSVSDAKDSKDSKDSKTPMTVRGAVAGSLFLPPAGGLPSSTVASYYMGAKVCVDSNNNAVCDSGEASTVTDKRGEFYLESPVSGPLVAEVLTTSTNAVLLRERDDDHRGKDDWKDDGKGKGKDGDENKHVPNAPRTVVFRASLDQIEEGATDSHRGEGRALNAHVTVTPLSTEVVRMMEADSLPYLTAKQDLAARLEVSAHEVLRDPNRVQDIVQTALLTESVILTNRFTFATKAFNRGDVHTMKEAEQAAMNVEGIPRYDHIFIVMLENKATLSIRNSPFAPKINGYLNSGNQFVNYFATGNPSEPNYTALGGADDFGITDDSQWNCDATGPNAVQDLPVPDKTQPGLASSPFAATCTQPPNLVNHNIVGKPNLFNALTAAGMSWRTYNESMNPGQDVRTDSVVDNAVIAPDHVYAPGTVGGNATTIGNPLLNLPLPAGLYKTKHHPGMAYQGVRSAPEFKASNRTLGGGQWDPVLLNSTAYAIPPGYNIDQFGSDLLSGDIGHLNFVIPDQCDDMHGITVRGTVPGNPALVTASDCASVANNVPITTPAPIITRGDNYVDFLVQKIQSSPIWRNPHKRVAIVLMFDEGNATSGFNSCCGWNPVNSKVANPLKQNPDGTFSKDTSVNNYTLGNRGHGNSIFGVLTNQVRAPKGISDSDAYSHFSFVRTLQDMFQLADPADDGSYMNRSKYTEKFIAANILNLPEYAGSADTHFDSVRPMNHAFVAPAGFAQKQSADRNTLPQVGPDITQTGVWALK
ncbi:MAG TPA: phosphoesterase [Burkholderiales bacterium]|nr:phosphoesterase [Burkholderiales bacterium]